MKAFQANFKPVLPKQYWPIVIWETWGWYFISQAMATPSWSLLWTTIVVHV